MKILLFSHLVCILLGSITSKIHLHKLLPKKVSGQTNREFTYSKMTLMFKIIEDLKEEGPIRCFHYVIDSDSHVVTHMIPRWSSKGQKPPEVSVPIKIVDYRQIRFNWFSSHLKVLLISIVAQMWWLDAPISSLNWLPWRKQASSLKNLHLSFTQPLVIISFSLMLPQEKMQEYDLGNFSKINSLIRE